MTVYAHSPIRGRKLPRYPQPTDVDDDAWSMHDLASRCPLAGFTAADRMDPYYDGLFGVGSGAAWTSAADARRLSAAGLGRTPKAWQMSEAEAIAHVSANRKWVDRLRVLAVVDAWRTCTFEQIAALTGVANAAIPQSRLVSSLFGANIVDVGVVPRVLASKNPLDRFALARSSRGPGFENVVFPRMSYVEWLQTTGGLPWFAGGFYDRHNVLATELGLRVSEYVDQVATVVGEKFTTHDMVAGSGAGAKPVDEFAQRRGDVGLIRRDGLRIVVELTAHAGPDFARKAHMWARRLSMPGAESVFVLFVTAEHLEPSKAWEDTTTRNTVFKQVSLAAREFAGSPQFPVAHRMGVVSWREWFSGRHELTERFLAGRVHRPTGEFGGARWETTDLFSDSGDVEPHFSDPVFATAVIDNSHLLLSTPYFVRDVSRAPDVARFLVEQHGWGRLPAVDPLPDFGYGLGDAPVGRLLPRLRPH